jgi:carbonic anhydrase
VPLRYGVVGTIDRLVVQAEAYSRQYTPDRPLAPALHLTIVACMDSRLDLFGLLGLQIGDAHVLRNAGGVITPDTIRSLAISQRRLDTRSVMLIHHTNCGMQTLTDDGFKAELQADTGMSPDWAVESFTDVASNVRQSLQRVRSNPFVPHRDDVRGFSFDVHTGRLHEVI